MVTKSNFSSPPRVRGEPIDVQEIEVELASIKYSGTSKPVKHTLHHLASADSSTNLDPDPAASTAPSTPSTASSSLPPEANDREPPKESSPRQDQQNTAPVTKRTNTKNNNQNTPETPKRMTGKQAITVPSKWQTPERAKPPLGSSKEDAAEPSVVEVQLANSPAKSHASSTIPLAETSKSTLGIKPSKISKAQRATSFPSIKTAAVASAMAATAIGAAAGSATSSSSATKSTTPTVASATKSNQSTASFAKSSQSMANATKASSITKSTSPTLASALTNQSMTSAVKSTKSATMSTTIAQAMSATSTSPTKTNASRSTLPTSADSAKATALIKSSSSTPALGRGMTPFKVPTVNRATTPVKPPQPVVSAAPSTAAPKSTESRLSPVFFRGLGAKTKSERDDDLVPGVVRDGKLCHVRLTLAFLTGVTAERLPEYQHLPLHNGKKHASSSSSKATTGYTSSGAPTTPDEQAPVGYALVSQGDGILALSHPMKPLNFATNAPRQTLIWTDNADAMSAINAPNDDDQDTPGERDDESQLTHSAGQRRLYFEVSLNRDGDSSTPPEPAPDVPDDATANEMLKEVAANFSPELVPITVGLRKGDDQVLPLGIATLVVSGREVSGQHMDLPVRPLTSAERVSLNGEPTDKKKKKGPGFRLFGGGKRVDAASVAAHASFKNEQHCYSLAPNATLRVRLDVRSGMYQQHGPALWGDLLVPRPDDESRCTVTVYDMSTQGDRETIKRSLIPLDDRHEYVEVLSNPNGTTIISSPGVAIGPSNILSSLPSKVQGRDDESLQTRFEVTSIFATSTEVRSTESGSENMSLLARLENAGICGGLDKLDDRAISSSNSFASTLPDVDPPELDSVKSGLSVAGQSAQARSSASRSKSLTRTSQSTGHFNANDDEDDDDDDNDGSVGASKSSGADSSSEAGTRTSAASRSVGDDTYEKVQEAKKTLLRYASRVGVEMEDLLVNDEDDSTFRRRESSSYSGSTDVSK